MINAVGINLPLKRMRLFSTSMRWELLCISACPGVDGGLPRVDVLEGEMSVFKFRQSALYSPIHFVYTFMHKIDYVLACTNLI